MTYGDIWIGDDDSETEILRGAKFSILLMLLITPLWISHFILVYFLKDLAACSFIPAVLTDLSSNFSALSPFLLMLVNYKMKLVSFCGAKKKNPHRSLQMLFFLHMLNGKEFKFNHWKTDPVSGEYSLKFS